MKRYLYVLVAIMAMSTLAHAVNVPFGVSWAPVVLKVNGHSIIVSQYRVYVCNQSISKSAIGQPVTCNGHMQSYTTSKTKMQGVYDSPQNSGTLRIRVTAIDLNGLESLLSGTRNLPFDMTSPANAPGTPTIDYTGEITDPDIVDSNIIEFTISWVPPNTDLAGNPKTPSNHVLYLCDQPITSRFDAENPNCTEPVATCAGNMEMFTITANSPFSGTYHASQPDGTLHGAISARLVVQESIGSNCLAGTFLESDLSNHDSLTWVSN
jgi:hypothetical protein